MLGSDSSIIFLFVILLAIWLVPLVIVWKNYDKLPMGQSLLAATVLWPMILVPDLSAMFWDTGAHSIFGLFSFIPLLVVTLLFFAIRTMTVLRFKASHFLNLLPCILLIGGQFPALTLPISSKLSYIQVSPTGDLLQHAVLYFLYLASCLCILYMSIRCSELLVRFHQHLPEQAVDIHFYQAKSVSSGFAVFSVLLFVCVVMLGLIMFGFVQVDYWQTVIHIILAIGLLYIIISLALDRRYTPSPLPPHYADKHNYSQSVLDETLHKAQNAIIKTRAYKKIGLRLQKLADYAKLDPLALAVALNEHRYGNFRALVFHYRLQYAKKVLVSSDAKVSVVARKLGFQSEQFLSHTFVKYVEKLVAEGKDDQPNMF